MSTRIGKIARLPFAIREQLNQRLEDGEPGTDLVAWLNELPEVRAVLTAQFGGRPVSEQNLTEWKQGGYRDWLRHEEACSLVRRFTIQAEALEAEANGLEISGRLSVVLQVELARVVEELLEDTTDPRERWERLLEALGRLAQLRREEANSGRLQLDRERWESEQKQAEQKEQGGQSLKPFYGMMLVRELITSFGGTNQEGNKAALELLAKYDRYQKEAAQAGTAKAAESVPPNQTESSLIKPNQTG